MLGFMVDTSFLCELDVFAALMGESVPFLGYSTFHVITWSLR